MPVESAALELRGRAVLAAALLYAVVTAWFLWPLPTALATHLLYSVDPWALIEADMDFALWAMSWTSHALTHDPVHLFDANIFHPMPAALALSDHMLGHQPIFAPVFLASGNPVLAGNVLILFDHWLAAMGGFLLAARFVPAPAAVVAGAVYAFLPIRLVNLMHPHVLAVGWLPLSLFFADRWLESARTRDGAAMAVTLGLQLLSSFYLAYALLVGWACALPVLGLRWRGRLDRRRLLGGLGWCAGGALPFLATSVPYVVLRSQGFLPQYDVGAGLASGLTRHVAWRRLVSRGSGPIAFALVLVGLAPRWRTRWAVVALGVTLVVCGWLFARGPAALMLGPLRLPNPYRLLQVVVPGFDAVRVPDRILVAGELGVALLAAAGANRLFRPVPARGRWVAAVAIVLLVLATPGERPPLALHHQPTGDSASPATRWLARHADGRPLLELPPTGLRRAARRMFASTAHWLPLLDGYTSHPPPVLHYLARRTGGLPSAEALARLVAEMDIGWILVHGEELGEGARRRWSEGELPPSLERLARFDRDLLFRVHMQGPPRGESPLYDQTHTPDGALRAPVGERCPGRLELKRDSGRVLPTAASVGLELRITNGGDTPWPAGGLLPKHQVRLYACLSRVGDAPAATDPDAPPCLAEPTLLLGDVAAGTTMDVYAGVTTPAEVGEFLLWVGLAQVGVGSLERCGVAPLAIPITLRERGRDLPSGSYWQSCRGCRGNGRELSCECLDAASNWVESMSDADCPRGFKNANGELQCEGSSRGASGSLARISDRMFRLDRRAPTP